MRSRSCWATSGFAVPNAPKTFSMMCCWTPEGSVEALAGAMPQLA
jgi:hypothetical protein